EHGGQRAAGQVGRERRRLPLVLVRDDLDVRVLRLEGRHLVRERLLRRRLGTGEQTDDVEGDRGVRVGGLVGRARRQRAQRERTHEGQRQRDGGGPRRASGPSGQ